MVDCDGIEPVAFAYVCDEQDKTIQKFFRWFRADSPITIEARAIFVDKVKEKNRILEEEFPETPVLIRAFHAIRAFETKPCGLALLVERKHNIFCKHLRVSYKAAQKWI